MRDDDPPRFRPVIACVTDLVRLHPNLLDELRPLLRGVEGESIVVVSHKGQQLLHVRAPQEIQEAILWRLYYLRNPG